MRRRTRNTIQTARRLYRSRYGILFGVCRGLADRFDISAWGLRIMLIISQLWVFDWTFLLYIAAIFILKPQPKMNRFERYGF